MKPSTTSLSRMTQQSIKLHLEYRWQNYPRNEVDRAKCSLIGNHDYQLIEAHEAAFLDSTYTTLKCIYCSKIKRLMTTGDLKTTLQIYGVHGVQSARKG